jgi:hypothetical protein
MVKIRSSSLQSKAWSSVSSGSQNKPLHHTNPEAPKTRSKRRAESSDKSDKIENNSQKDKVSSCGSGGANPVTVSSQSLTGTEPDSISLIENENPPTKKRTCMKTVQAGKEGPDCGNACRVSVICPIHFRTWSQFPLLYAVYHINEVRYLMSSN